jgi:hypothetical protein
MLMSLLPTLAVRMSRGPVAIQVTHRDIRRAGSDGKR